MRFVIKYLHRYGPTSPMVGQVAWRGTKVFPVLNLESGLAEAERQWEKILREAEQSQVEFIRLEKVETVDWRPE